MPALDDVRRAILPELNRVEDDLDELEEQVEAKITAAVTELRQRVDAVVTEGVGAIRARVAAMNVVLQAPQPTEPTEPPPTAEQQPA